MTVRLKIVQLYLKHYLHKNAASIFSFRNRILKNINFFLILYLIFNYILFGITCRKNSVVEKKS